MSDEAFFPKDPGSSPGVNRNSVEAAETDADGQDEGVRKSVKCDCESRKKGGNCIHYFRGIPMGAQVVGLDADPLITGPNHELYGNGIG